MGPAGTAHAVDRRRSTGFGARLVATTQPRAATPAVRCGRTGTRYTPPRGARTGARYGPCRDRRPTAGGRLAALRAPGSRPGDHSRAAVAARWLGLRRDARAPRR